MAFTSPARTLCLLVVLSAGLRLPGLWTDLWLDELWSIDNAIKAASWLDIFLSLRIDNNHHLYSLYLFAIGPGGSPIAYRMLAYVSGLGTVIAAWLIGAREDYRTAAVTALLFATSFLFVQYSSEARGYATAVCMALWAWNALNRYLESGSFRNQLVFGLTCAAGLLAHRTFAFFIIGAALWCDAHVERSRSLRVATWTTARAFAVPAATLAILWAGVFRNTVIGDGPSYNAARIVAETASLVSGSVNKATGPWAAAAVAAVVVASITSAVRRRDDRWILTMTTGIVIPALFVIIGRPAILAPRYFLVSMTVLLLSAGGWLAHSLGIGGTRRRIAQALLAAHVLGSAAATFNAQASSRGEYRQALRLVAAAGPATLASSDRFVGHDFRTALLVRYHAPPGVHYVFGPQYPAEGTQWLIVESLTTDQQDSVLKDRSGNVFAWRGTYPAGILSGFTWHVYQQRIPMTRIVPPTVRIHRE